MLDFNRLEYHTSRGMVVADQSLRDLIVQSGLRPLMRATKLSQHTIEKILAGRPLRFATLKRMQAAVV